MHRTIPRFFLPKTLLPTRHFSFQVFSWICLGQTSRHCVWDTRYNLDMHGDCQQKAGEISASHLQFWHMDCKKEKILILCTSTKKKCKLFPHASNKVIFTQLDWRFFSFVIQNLINTWFNSHNAVQCQYGKAIWFACAQSSCAEILHLQRNQCEAARC